MINERVEAQAEQLLTRLKVEDVPVPIEVIASALDIKISRAPSSDFSGLLIRKDGKALVGVNSREAPVRQRFTIAHEIGHFVLHPQKDAFVDFRKERTSGESKPARERDADMFAAALLMPRKTLLRDFRRLAKDLETEEITEKLARRYLVSVDAMRYRLINLSSLRQQF